MSGLTSLWEPDWIDWNETNEYPLSNGYRRITSVNGGPSSSNLEWMDANMDTLSGKTGKYTWSKDPDYMWYMSEDKSAHLKVSPVISPGGSTCSTEDLDPTISGDCSTSSCDTEKCKMIYADGRASNMCYGAVDLQPTDIFRFVTNTKSRTKWKYNTNQTSITPAKDGQGMFCANVENRLGSAPGPGSIGGYLSCQPNFCSQFSQPFTYCKGMEVGHKCSDNSYLATDDPGIDKKDWQFIDEISAVACCTQPTSPPENVRPQCAGAFNVNSQASKCVPLMGSFCSGHWGSSTNIGKQCSAFLNQSPFAPNVVNDTIINYITNPLRTMGFGGIQTDVWQDYISPTVALNNTSSVAADYYRAYGINPSQPLPEGARDDSKDPFYQSSLVTMCNSVSNTKAGACDGVMNYFCKAFAPTDISGVNGIDMTLYNMCGCHLITADNQQVPAPTTYGTQSNPWQLKGVAKPTPQYYGSETNQVLVNGAECSPICLNATLKNNAFGGGDGKCTGTQCVMDNVTVNIINSEIKDGGVNITQTCGTCQDAQCTCYLSNVNINSINSIIGKGINMFSQCGSCYYFEGDNTSQSCLCSPEKCGVCGDCQPPDANGLCSDGTKGGCPDPTPPPGNGGGDPPPGNGGGDDPPPGNGGNGGGNGGGGTKPPPTPPSPPGTASWFKKHKTQVLIGIGVVIAILFIMIMFSMFHKKEGVGEVSTGSGLEDYYAAYSY